MSESLPDLRDVKSRLQEASTYLRIEEILDRKIELEDLVAQPGFWDDAKGAKKLSQELAEISEDITVYQNLMIKIEDAETVNFILADGLGFLNLQSTDSFLNKHINNTINTTFPSSTNVALTTIAMQASPIDHGIFGKRKRFKR